MSDALTMEALARLVPVGSRVLDLGCGSGRLLARLKRKGHRRLVGVELDEQKILACICRGLDVVQADLNKGLRTFADQQFDCVVLSQTLQAVLDVEGVIDCHGVCFQERKHVPTAMCTRVGGRTESSMGEVSGAAVHSVQSRSMNLG